MRIGIKPEWHQASVYGWRSGDLVAVIHGGWEVAIPGAWTREASDSTHQGAVVWLQMAGDELKSVVWDPEKPEQRGDY